MWVGGAAVLNVHILKINWSDNPFSSLDIYIFMEWFSTQLHSSDQYHGQHPPPTLLH